MRNLKNCSPAGLRAFLCAFLITLFIAAPLARAADEKEAAKNVLGKCADAVISVKAVIKVRVIVGGAEQLKDESEIETIATVIDPSGLAVLSFSCIDPTRIYGGILKKLKAANEGPQVDINSDITGITMVMPDGREIPAKVILRDGDLDLAFVRPTEKPDKPIACLDINGECKPDVLDSILILSRLDKVAGRCPSISLQRIEAMVPTPRKFYVTDSTALMGRLGAPVFSLDGKVVGFSLLKFTKSNDKSRMGKFTATGMNALGIMPIILPVGEVSTAAKQAIGMKDK
jgi:hypothetical protein